MLALFGPSTRLETTGRKGLAVLRIGVYGGTFNPPHLGHMASARAAMEELRLDKLILIPTADPPHKVLPEESAEGLARLEMTRLMADGLEEQLNREGDVSAIDLELQRPGKSYTADTLAQLHAAYPEDELWLLMGADMFLTFPAWHEPEKIASLAHLVTFAREERVDREVLEGQAAELQKRFGASSVILSLARVVALSSTQIRAALALGDGTGLWMPVYGYILRRQLYCVQKDLKSLSDEDLRAVSYSMVKAKRIRHICGTEQAAVALAVRWGADVGKARRAAILHDCTKYLSGEEQLQLCRRYGVALDALEREAVKLLHAKTGAWIARDEFGVDDDIFYAIYWHTTGRARMSLLEQVLYLADYMEPNRVFPGVEELRDLAVRDLNAAVLRGFELSVEEMRERALPVHPNTLEARAWMLEQIGYRNCVT